MTETDGSRGLEILKTQTSHSSINTNQVKLEIHDTSSVSFIHIYLKRKFVSNYMSLVFQHKFILFINYDFFETSILFSVSTLSALNLYNLL